MVVCCALVSLCLPDWCQTCLHVNVMCAHAPWACTYQQYIFSLITGHIWGRGAATASRYWIQQVIFLVTNPVRNNYNNFRNSHFIPTVIPYSVEHRIEMLFCINQLLLNNDRNKWGFFSVSNLYN